MIDDSKPIPDNDLDENLKAEYFYGPYRKIHFCKECRYFLIPEQFFFVGDCCPNCGNDDFGLVVGRYKIKAVKKGFSIFSWFKEEIFGFTPKTEFSGGGYPFYRSLRDENR